MKVTYCSFADDSKCLGLLVLPGHHGPMSARSCATVLGLNPGGQLVALPIDTSGEDVPRSVAQSLERAAQAPCLLSPEEAVALFEACSINQAIDEGLVTEPQVQQHTQPLLCEQE